MVEISKILPHITVFVGIVLCLISGVPACCSYVLILLNGYFMIFGFICCLISLSFLVCSGISYGIGVYFYFTEKVGKGNLYLLVHTLVCGVFVFVAPIIGCLCFIPIYPIAVIVTIPLVLWALICFPCFPCIIICIAIPCIGCIAYIPPSIPFIPGCLSCIAFIPHGGYQAYLSGKELLDGEEK